jgi:hypothetical protein
VGRVHAVVCVAGSFGSVAATPGGSPKAMAAYATAYGRSARRTAALPTYLTYNSFL